MEKTLQIGMGLPNQGTRPDFCGTTSVIGSCRTARFHSLTVNPPDVGAQSGKEAALRRAFARV